MSSELTVTDIGEFGLIDRIAAFAGPDQTVVGIGDDAAVIETPGPDYLLATVDMLVEGVHFPHDADSVQVGRRALAVNLSDIAAMGGIPTYALTSVALPPDTPLSFVDGLYRGLTQEAKQVDVTLIGGNITSTAGPIAVDVVQLGRVPRDQVVLRSGAQVGDALVVTGVLGAERAGRILRSVEGHATLPSLSVPGPRLHTGRSLASRGLAHAMLDVSDGLGSDLHHLARQSAVGAVVYAEQLPIAIAARKAGRVTGQDPEEIALYGGEDYELLVAVPPDRMNEAIEAAGTSPLYTIGTVLPAEHGVVIERPGGQRESLAPRGWTHF